MWFFQSGITLENAIVRIIASLAIIFLVMPFHEFAHGFVAQLCGDNTAKLTGRLSMNPLNNVEPLGAAAILFLGMGWAKPVPVNVYNFKNKRLGTFLTYFAGPILNILAAILAGLIFAVFSFDLTVISEYLIGFYAGFALVTSFTGITLVGVIIGILVGLILAVIAIRYSKYIIMIATAYIGAHLIAPLLPQVITSISVSTAILAIILFVIGLCVQLLTNLRKENYEDD